MDNKEFNILLIEDNLKYVRLFHYLIEDDKSCRMQFKHADSLAQALSCLEKESFDIVVMDLFLPDTTGLKGMEVIQEKYPRLPIIFLTALDDRATRSQALKQGAKAYLLKDQIVEHFIPTVRNVVSASL